MPRPSTNDNEHELESELPDDGDIEGGDEDRGGGRRAARPTNGTGRRNEPRASRRTPAPEESEEPAEHQHPPRLVRLARVMGFSQADIDATPSEQLFLAVQQEQQIRDAERRATPRQPEPRREEPRPAPTAPARPEEEEFDFERDFEDGQGGTVRRKVKLGDYDPLIQRLYTENKALRTRLEERDKAEGEREKKSMFARVDDAFEALGDEKLYGSGSIEELYAAGAQEEITRRNAVAAAAGIQQGDSQRTIDRKIRAAHKAVYGAAPAREEDAAEYGARPAKNGKPARPTRRERWEGGVVARPTNRRGAALPRGNEAADQAIRDWMEEHGYDPGPRKSHALEDELPDDDDM